MEINPNSLYQQMQSMATEAQGLPSNMLPGLQQQEINPSRAQFAEMLGDAINGVNDLQANSRELQKRFEMGDPNLSLVDVMVAKEKSGIAFEATVQVRNKLLEAYRTIMNMPV